MQKPARRNSVLNSPRVSELKNKKKKIFIRKIVIFLVAILIILGSLSYLSRIKRINIYNVEVSGNKVIDTEAVREITDRDLAGKYLWLFPKTNIFLYPKNKIKNDLANKFKRFKDISISENGKTLSISVSERSPEYTWCGVAPTADTSKETCYFLDKEGYIFDVAPYFSGDVYFKFYGQNEGDNQNPAGTYFDKSYFDKLISLKDSMLFMNLKPVVLYQDYLDDIKVFLSRDKNITTGPHILLKRNSDFERVAENLRAAITTEPLQSKLKNNYSTLQYIDLRFGNKVYYKFTNTAPSTPPVKK